jgi:hypothetical protein
MVGARPVYEEALQADERELKCMFQTRLRVAKPEELKDYSQDQLCKCLEMRVAHTRKRPTPEQESEQVPGSLKSRMVAKDLKVWNKEPIERTFAATPGMIAWRLNIANTDLAVCRESATDYDVAFLQGYSYKELGMPDVLVRWKDYRDGNKVVYGFLEGPAYGQQVCMYIWKLTHGTYLVEGLGFSELCNQQSVYRHRELDITILVHVDDPWVHVGPGNRDVEDTDPKLLQIELEAKEDQMHAALNRRFKTKGKRVLAVGQPPLDYLSMVVSTPDDRCIEISTDPYTEKILETFDMVGCTPASTPITRQLLRDCKADVEAGNYMDQEETRNYQKAVGIFNWRSQTIGFDTALATSISGKYNAHPVRACEALIQQQVKYVAGTLGQRLRNHPDSQNRLVCASDSDLAGLYSLDGDTRSRGCGVMCYKDMVVDYWTGWIGKFNSSGLAETVALSSVLRRAMHVKYVGEEMGIAMPRVITIYVDATVALSFAADVGPPTGMKFVDLRESWVTQLRDRSVVQALKIDTRLNPADFGTKIHDRGEFERQRSFFLDTPRYRRQQATRKVDMTMVAAVCGMDKMLNWCQQLTRNMFG